MHGGLIRYTLRNWTLSAASTLRGARPCVPATLSAPVPNAPLPTQMMVSGALGGSRVRPLARGTPLRLHPVVIVGNLITSCVRAVSERVYASLVLGLAGGTGLQLSLIAGTLASAWLILTAARAGVALVAVTVAARLPGSTRSIHASATTASTNGLASLQRASTTSSTWRPLASPPSLSRSLRSRLPIAMPLAAFASHGATAHSVSLRTLGPR